MFSTVGEHLPQCCNGERAGRYQFGYFYPLLLFVLIILQYSDKTVECISALSLIRWKYWDRKHATSLLQCHSPCVCEHVGYIPHTRTSVWLKQTIRRRALFYRTVGRSVILFVSDRSETIDIFGHRSRVIATPRRTRHELDPTYILINCDGRRSLDAEIERSSRRSRIKIALFLSVNPSYLSPFRSDFSAYD